MSVVDERKKVSAANKMAEKQRILDRWLGNMETTGRYRDPAAKFAG